MSRPISVSLHIQAEEVTVEVTAEVRGDFICIHEARVYDSNGSEAHSDWAWRVIVIKGGWLEAVEEAVLAEWKRVQRRAA